jgi:hypothetical protein
MSSVHPESQAIAPADHPVAWTTRTLTDSDGWFVPPVVVPILLVLMVIAYWVSKNV